MTIELIDLLKYLVPLAIVAGFGIDKLFIYLSEKADKRGHDHSADGH